MATDKFPFSNLFFALGAIIILRACYDQYTGTYYDYEELSYYTDTLRAKPILEHRSKRSDYYEFLLSYSKSRFIITDNSYSIILGDKKKLNDVQLLDADSVITVSYLTSDDYLTNANKNKVKAIGLSLNNHVIVSPQEVLAADREEKRKTFLIGGCLVICGFISLYIQKRKKKQSEQ